MILRTCTGPKPYRKLCCTAVGMVGMVASLFALPVLATDGRAAKVNFTIEGTLVEVEDGDTLTLRGVGGGRFHIRLSDLDAPEVAHASNPYRERRNCRNAPARAGGQADGEAARAALLRRAPRKAAARAECYTIDRYGRPVCHVFVGATNLNLAQLRDGWAMLLSKREWIRDPASAAAEQQARAARRGIWAGDHRQTPDSWRARCWCEGVCANDGR
jgi:endonuclease YncB( thermonuclease family)